jgi:hypothetical protein
MGNGNDIYEEMDNIKRRIAELEEKLGGGFYSEGDKLRKSTITAEEKRELEQLHERLKQLKEEEDKAQGIK